MVLSSGVHIARRAEEGACGRVAVAVGSFPRPRGVVSVPGEKPGSSGGAEVNDGSGFDEVFEFLPGVFGWVAVEVGYEDGDGVVHCVPRVWFYGSVSWFVCLETSGYWVAVWVGIERLIRESRLALGRAPLQMVLGVVFTV
jgi:hypothetical protein